MELRRNNQQGVKFDKRVALKGDVAVMIQHISLLQTIGFELCYPAFFHKS